MRLSASTVLARNVRIHEKTNGYRWMRAVGRDPSFRFTVKP